jgi:hypothetical protein
MQVKAFKTPMDTLHDKLKYHVGGKWEEEIKVAATVEAKEPEASKWYITYSTPVYMQNKIVCNVSFI